MKGLKEFLTSKIFITFSLFLIFGIVTVFAGNIIVNEYGIQSENYYSGSGQEGITENISYKDSAGEDKVLIVESGLIVGVDEDDSGSSGGGTGETGWTEGLSEGLVAYYSFDETSGTTLYDSVGNNNGVASNSRIFTSLVEGKSETAGDFSYDDYVDISDIPGGSNDEHSISVWFYPNEWPTTSYHVAIYKLINRRDIVLLINETQDIRLQVYQDGWKSKGYYSAPILNQWYHFVWSFNGSAWNFYVDGTLNSTLIDSTPIRSALADTSTIGSDANPDHYLQGTIDEIGIWNRALTDSEIEILYNNGDGITYS